MYACALLRLLRPTQYLSPLPVGEGLPALRIIIVLATESTLTMISILLLVTVITGVIFLSSGTANRIGAADPGDVAVVHPKLSDVDSFSQPWPAGLIQ